MSKSEKPRLPATSPAPQSANGQCIEPGAFDRGFLAIFVACCAAALVPLWSVAYPPMVDLAQHAAQVAIWHRWGEGAFDYGHYLWVNWYTPYVVTNSLAAVLSSVMPVSVAFKLVISFAVLGTPVATLALVREAGGDPLWALLVVPAGYSFAFYMGFVAFAFAVPLALCFVLLAWRYGKAPTLGRGLTLLVFSQVLFLTHVIAFGWAGLTGALVVASLAPGWRGVLRRWWPFLAALILPASWLLFALLSEDLDPSPPGSGGYGWSRLLQIFSFAVGFPINDLSLALGVVSFSLPFAAGGRASRERTRWIPFLVALALFLVTPNRLMGTAYLHQRFAILFLPTLLFALDPGRRSPAARRRWGLVLGTTAIVWLSLIQLQFLRFRTEVGGFRDLLGIMEPDRYVLYLPLQWGSDSVPYPVFLHFGSWYQVEKGGLVDYSFAEMFPNRFRYRDDAKPQLPSEPASSWQPRKFDWWLHDGQRYDYFLVRWPQDPSLLFRRTEAPVVPLAAAPGGWWLYVPTERDAPASRSSESRAGSPH